LNGFDSLECFKGYPGFECGVVSSAFGFHLDGFQVGLLIAHTPPFL